jgi:hypothetical protein
MQKFYESNLFFYSQNVSPITPSPGQFIVENKLPNVIGKLNKT